MKRGTLMFLIYAGLAVLIVLVLALSAVFPIFMCSILTIASVSLAYVLTENMWTHDAAEFENRFWTLVAFSLAYTVIFVSDSPLLWRTENSLLKWTACIGITYIAHNYDRHLRRMVLKKMPNIKRIRSLHFEQEHRITAKQKVAHTYAHAHSHSHTYRGTWTQRDRHIHIHRDRRT